MNACDDFMILLLQGYITMAAVEVLGLKLIDHWPTGFYPEIFVWGEANPTHFHVETFVHVCHKNMCALLWLDSHHLSTWCMTTSIGSLYMEFADAVRRRWRMGIRCWKFFIIIFHNSNHKNNAKEAALILYQHQYVLSPPERLIYNCFINISGVPGRNVSADLHMEHLEHLKVVLVLL